MDANSNASADWLGGSTLRFGGLYEALVLFSGIRV